MNAFQWIVLSLLAVVIIGEIHRWLRRGVSQFGLFRFAVWIATGIAVAKPVIPHAVAQWMGIGRGADVVLYLFVLAFVVVSFFFYARYLEVREQITQVTRTLAIQNARRLTVDERNAT
jgi:hypothetical protein